MVIVFVNVTCTVNFQQCVTYDRLAYPSLLEIVSCLYKKKRNFN